MARLAEQYADAHCIFGLPQSTKRPTNQSSYVRKPDNRQPHKTYSTQVNTPSSQNHQRFDGNRAPPPPTCYICHKVGHIARNCRSRPKNYSQVASIIASALTNVLDDPSLSDTDAQLSEHSEQKDNYTAKAAQTYETVACTISPHTLSKCCSKNGYAELTCGHRLPVISAVCQDKNPSSLPVVEGLINGQMVKVLRDTGCSGIVVRQDLVTNGQMIGETRSYILADRTIRKAPVAAVTLDTPYFVGSCEALCMPNPVYDVIIGNIVGVRQLGDPDPNWLNPQLKVQQGIIVGPEVKPTSQTQQDMRVIPEMTQTSEPLLSSAVETRAQKLKCEKPPKKTECTNRIT